MAAQIDVVKLRVSNRPAIANYLQSLVKAVSTDSQRISITQQLHDAVASGSVSAYVYIIYMSVSKKYDFHPLVHGLRQTHNNAIRRAAARELHRALRHGQSFGPAWAAVGGAPGLASLMKDSSVCDVAALCQQLGRTSGATDVRNERQAAMADLIATVQPPQQFSMAIDDTNERDPRPLRSSYARVVPAATIEVIDEWEKDGFVDYTKGIRTTLYKAHPRRYQRMFLDKIFSADHKDSRMREGTHLFRPDMDFAEELLRTLAEGEPKTTHIPPDIMTEFINPFLKRLLDSPKRKSTLARVFQLIVAAFERHSYLSEKHFNNGHNGIFQIAIKRFNHARDETASFWLEQISTLTGLVPRMWWFSDIYSICDIVKKVDLEKRYRLLRVLLNKHRTYKLDLDATNDAFVSRLQQLRSEKHNIWPLPLFSQILNNGDALNLFQKVWAAYPGGDFLGSDREQCGHSVLQQTCKNSSRPDPETLNCVLIRASQTFDRSDPAWLAHARSSVEQRKKKAEQTRDFSERGFWAKSALMLCIAAGDLRTYKELIVWIRRFNKDAQACEMVYGRSTLFTEEGIVLLSGFPVTVAENQTLGGETVYLQPIDNSAELSERISTTNDIMDTMLETAMSVAAQPTFKASHRDALLEMPIKVLEQRRRNLPNLKKTLSVTDAELNALVWKPSIDFIMGATRRARQMHVDRYIGDLPVKLAGFIRSLASLINAGALSDLISYFLERAKLDESSIKNLSYDILLMVQSLAESEQPALACSFVGSIVLGEDDNSSWYRQLLKPSFVASLPSKIARDFLTLLADSLKEKLEMQNTRSANRAAALRGQDDKTTAKDQSIVKVTTIKMFAQLLRDATFIDHESSCRLLMSLLPHTRHVDILVTVIQSLFATLNHRSTTAEMRVQIMDAIEEYAVPVAGRLDERRHMTKADWASAEAMKAPPPDVNQDHTVFDVLNSHACKEKLLPHERNRIVQWLFQALDQQASNNARWMALYIRRNGFSVDDLDQDFLISAGPVNLDLLVTVCEQHTSHLTSPAFEMIKRIVSANIDPPAIISEMSKTIRDTPEKNNSTSGKHWLAHYGNSREAVLWGPNQCADALCRVPSDSEPDLSSEIVAQLQDVVVEACKALTFGGEVQALKELITRLGDSWTKGRLEIWKLHALPVLEQVVEGVDGLRTEEWQTSATRNPPELLDTFWVRIRMLAIPYWEDCDGIEAIPEELSALIELLASQKVPYHDCWGELKSRLLYSPTTPSDIALKIGRLDGVNLEDPTLADHLRHELAYELLKTAQLHIVREDGQILDMIRTWTECRVERWRPHGRDIFERMEKCDQEGERT